MSQSLVKLSAAQENGRAKTEKIKPAWLVVTRGFHLVYYMLGISTYILRQKYALR